MIRFTTEASWSAGTEKPIPALLPDVVKMAVLIPTTSPFRFNRGPPLFPGLIAASVWMQLRMGRLAGVRAASTTAIVSDGSRPRENRRPTQSRGTSARLLLLDAPDAVAFVDSQRLTAVVTLLLGKTNHRGTETFGHNGLILQTLPSVPRGTPSPGPTVPPPSRSRPFPCRPRCLPKRNETTLVELPNGRQVPRRPPRAAREARFVGPADVVEVSAADYRKFLAQHEEARREFVHTPNKSVEFPLGTVRYRMLGAVCALP